MNSLLKTEVQPIPKTLYKAMENVKCNCGVMDHPLSINARDAHKSICIISSLKRESFKKEEG
jgi:hypothetical protein